MSSREREFERLVEQYERRLFNVALRLTSNADDAAELTQETFLRAFRAWDKFRKESKAYTWLYRILLNLNKDRLAKAGRRREKEVPLASSSEGESVEMADERTDLQASAENSQLRDALKDAIESLPRGYRECVVLRDLEGLSYEEIGEAMGITVEAVRSRLARARQQLRQRLASHLRIQS